MAWINKIAKHDMALGYAEDFRTNENPFDPPSMEASYMAAAAALGDARSLRAMAHRAMPIYEKILGLRLNDDLFKTDGPAAAVLERICLFEMAGYDQRDAWRKVLAARPPRGAEARALRAIVDSFDAPLASEPPSQTSLQYPTTERAFRRDLARLSTADLLAVTDSPDHPDYGPLFQPYVLPLTIKRARQLGIAPIEIYAEGPWPDRRGKLLYGRTKPRPELGVAVNKRKPATWYDFDAVEQKDGQVLVHHYVGIGWKAPLTFEDDLNGFALLDSLEHDWAHVQKTVGAAAWRAIEKARSQGKVTHIVSYDPADSMVVEGAPEVAGEHYGVRIVTKSLFEV